MSDRKTMTTASALTYEQFFNSELFADVQLMPVFGDSKTFADAVPNAPLPEILEHYSQQKSMPDFSLKRFVHQNFEIREKEESQKVSIAPRESKNDTETQVKQHILVLWDELRRDADAPTESNTSLIPLPHSYIVPGGRFQEIYYWDTYFTALGLALDKKYQLILDTFKNFQFLIANNGCVPNGNRDYYRGRSQPPVMALLHHLLQEHKAVLPEVSKSEFKHSALKSLRLEYDFWMAGKRVVSMPDSSLLNRYWDDESGPRPESYKEDIELADSLNVKQKDEFYRHIRAACESGWDFSSRWLAQTDDLASIRTCDIIPVDLNCLLYFLEFSLSQMYADCLKHQEAQLFKDAARARVNAIQKYLWNSETGLYHDYCLAESKTTEVISLATTLPLFFKLTTESQAASVKKRLASEFLKPGGFVTTLTHSPQQWDSPNAWAPLQWFAVIGLENYGFTELANTAMHNWLKNIEQCFGQYPGMMEKYNAENVGIAARGGEYQVQEGFGWTNGVTRAFYEKLKR